MSDGNDLPVNNDLPAVNEQSPVSCSPTSCCVGTSIVRALIYTPVILGLSSLAALAMFPSLADYTGSSAGKSTSATCSSSGGNPNCPIQMLMRCFSSQPKQQSSDPGLTPAGCISSAAMQEEFGCCPHSRGCLSRPTESKVSEEVTNESQTTAEEPADALAAVLSNQQPLEIQDQSASN